MRKPHSSWWASRRAPLRVAVVLVVMLQLCGVAAGGEQTPRRLVLTYVSPTPSPAAVEQVLIAGGAGGAKDQALSSAEVYNVKTGTFALTGKLLGAQFDNTATTLLNGEVLLAGGAQPQAVRLAELYNPVTGKFTQTGNLGIGRESPSATLLRDAPDRNLRGPESSSRMSFLTSRQVFACLVPDTSSDFVPCLVRFAVQRSP